MNFLSKLNSIIQFPTSLTVLNLQIYVLIASTKAVKFPTLQTNCPLKTLDSEETLAFRAADPCEFGSCLFIHNLGTLHSFKKAHFM